MTDQYHAVSIRPDGLGYLRLGKIKESRMPQFSNEQHEQIEKLAYRLWQERGGPLGSPDDDWFLAEKEFIHSPSRLPFASLLVEPLDY